VRAIYLGKEGKERTDDAKVEGGLVEALNSKKEDAWGRGEREAVLIG